MRLLLTQALYMEDGREKSWQCAGRFPWTISFNLPNRPWGASWSRAGGRGRGGTFPRPGNQREAKPRFDAGVVSLGSTHLISFVLPVFPPPDYSTVISPTDADDGKCQNYN